MGLIHAEKAQKLLLEDIEDQKEMEDYYFYPAINSRGETLDILQLNSATKLASGTVYKLTIGTVIATIYLLVCLSLFAGVFKNRSRLIVPWMVFDVIASLFTNSVLLIIGTSMIYRRFAISNWFYCKYIQITKILSLLKLVFLGVFFLFYTTVDLCFWIVVFQYYSILRQMAKLREEAVIPAPIVTPYLHFHENTIESFNGLKHTLCNLEKST